MGSSDHSNSTDFVLPKDNILIRNFTFHNGSSEDIFLKFFYYNDLAISETDIDDVAYYLPRNDAIVHYKRSIYFLYGSPTKSSGHQCGVHGESSDAFNDVYDSRLSGGSLVLYDGSRAVNSCLSWDIGNIQKGENKNLTVFTALGSDEKEVLRGRERFMCSLNGNALSILHSFVSALIIHWLNQENFNAVRTAIAITVFLWGFAFIALYLCIIRKTNKSNK